MKLLRVGCWVAVAALYASPALAQDDDLLVPLTAPGKAKPKATKRKPKAARPAPKPAKEEEEDLLAPLTQPKGQLVAKISAGVRGAKLFIDDREISTLPAPPQEVPAGDHAVLVKRAGYADFARTVTVKEGATTEVNVLLEAISGVLSVTSSIPGAQVFVDGQPLGAAPVNEQPLTPGDHDVTVVKEGYAEQLTRLQVRPGKDYPLHAELVPASDRPARASLAPDGAGGQGMELGVSQTAAPAQPWFKRWYVWAAAGAVVVGVTTVAVVSSQGFGPKNREAVCGFPGPPKPCSPTTDGDQGTVGFPLSVPPP